MPKPTKVCEFPECDRPGRSKNGYCKAHSEQLATTGKLKKLRVRCSSPNLNDRIDAHSVQSGKCRIWTGSKSWHPSGSGKYMGQIRVDGKLWLVHRLSYTINVGTIPDGMQIDHMCRNSACVNPDHLQLATNKTNNENMSGAQANSKSGIRGVTWFKPKRKWRATVVHHGKQYGGGYFNDIEDAERSAIALRKRLFTNNLKDYEVPSE